MDLVFHRYASPFLLLDQVVNNDELSEFVNMIWDVTKKNVNGNISLQKFLINHLRTLSSL